MENQRTLLYLSLFFILFLMYQAWQEDYGPKPEPVAKSQSAAEQKNNLADDVPDAAIPDESTRTAEMSAVAAPLEHASPQGRIISVVTDVLQLEIDTNGGDIRQMYLRRYPATADDDGRLFELLSSKMDNFHIAQSGIISSKSITPDSAAANSIYISEQDDYRLAEGKDELKVVLSWQQDGVKVDKIFTFKRDSYLIDVEHIVTAGEENWFGQQYRQLKRTQGSGEGESFFIYTYTGGVVYNEELKYEKITFSEMTDKRHLADIGLGNRMQGGWLAMIQHYFLAAWVPDQNEKNKVYTKYIEHSNQYIMGMVSPIKEILAGEQGRFHSQLVVGPKLQGRLEEIAPGLELTVDYGVLTIIAKPLFWLLEKFHSVFNNWGWAIIFLTLTVKLLFYKLSETSYKSMAKMRKVAPRMKAMKERFGDDRQAMSKAMMKMYKEEKINPLGGCLPILVQMPVFIALYWVLLESVEMRNAPFALWIQNLSAQDPYYILPLIMGATMYIQQKLNPAPLDPIQQKVFQFMPILFTVFFMFFPSGLVLYWVVNNTLSIIQQWIITRRIENE
jgi:YidC/Oxa1 family membrane protein insertase